MLRRSFQPIAKPAIHKQHGNLPHLIMINNIFQFTAENIMENGTHVPIVIRILLISRYLRVPRVVIRRIQQTRNTMGYPDISTTA
jgi:hypothetical protein